MENAKRIRFGDAIFYVFGDVYEPAEDSYLIARHMDVRGHVLDMGAGCGILSVLAASKAKRVLAVDINPKAARCVRFNAKINGVSEKIDVLAGDLFNPLREGRTFDVILFNAPYLPSDDAGKLEWIDYAWSGGKSGREVIDRFLRQIPKYLKLDGKLLLIQSSLSNIEETLKSLRRLGFDARIIAEEGSFFERIILIEAHRRADAN